MLVLICNIGHRTLPKIRVYTSLVRSVHLRRKTEVILTVKMETRHPVEVGLHLAVNFPICNHCGVMTAWSGKICKFCEQFLRFFGKSDPFQAVAPKICQGQPPHLAYTVPDFIQIAHFRRSYCRTREDRFCPVLRLQYRLLEPIITVVNRHWRHFPAQLAHESAPLPV